MGIVLTKTEDSIVKEYEKKITWTIKNFSSLQADKIFSDYFVVGDCKWRLRVYPKGIKVGDNLLSLFLGVADSELLPCGWRRHIKFRQTVVNQFQEELSKVKETQSSWFDQKNPTKGFDVPPLIELHAKDGGFLVNDEVKIITEIDILEVIGISDALEEETTPVNVNGFHEVLPSQVKSVDSLFERHQHIVTNGKNQYEKKITWTLKNFASLQSETIFSDHFVFGDCKWLLKAYPKGYKDFDNQVSLFIGVANFEFLHHEWRRHAQFRLTFVNQLREELSEVRESEPKWFTKKNPTWGIVNMLSHTKLNAKDGGFLVNDEVKIIVEVYVIEVIGQSDALEEKTTFVIETINVNGFQVLPSQVKYVNSLFERHPYIATNVKSQYLKTGFMNVLISLTYTLEKLTEKFSNDDLLDAYVALEHMTNAGFELDWLKNKFDQVEENIRKEKADEFRMQAIKEKNNDLSRWDSQIKVTKRKPKWKKTLHHVSKSACKGKEHCTEFQTTPVMETIDVNGFQILPSQVIYVNHLFERHPNIATNVKNQYLKAWFMNVLVNLIDTLEKSPEIISKSDLSDVYVALEYMVHAGFELDWLRNSLDLRENEKADL